MAIRLYNTLTRKVEELKPLKPGQLAIYSCGPTVYDYAHIGNFRTFVATDLLLRWLRYRGLKLTHVMNLTDVDDKTIAGARAAGIPLRQFTDRYVKAFFEDIATLNISHADHYPRATAHIKEMVGLIRRLLANGYAYKAEDGSTYYDISRFKNYGALAGLTPEALEKLKPGARVAVQEYAKEQLADFALWKAWTPEDGDVFWVDEVLGKGRPGWHIECSAMAMAYLGQSLDVHAGGVDLIFPHHQNEIAQSEAATGKQFVRHWFHVEHLFVEGKKMSKSLGNYYTLRDILKLGYKPAAIRYLLLSVHYRQQLNFTFPALKAADAAVAHLNNLIDALGTVKAGEHNPAVRLAIESTAKRFADAMDNDLDIANALAALFEFSHHINRHVVEQTLSAEDAQTCIAFLRSLDRVLGVLEPARAKEALPPETEELIRQREALRKAARWLEADALREKLRRMGVLVFDTPWGPSWKIVR